MESRARLLQHDTGAHEKQRFENGVVEYVEQATGKSQYGHDRIFHFHTDHADADADENDADVFDAVVCEQSFEIMLSQGVRPHPGCRRATPKTRIMVPIVGV